MADLLDDMTFLEEEVSSPRKMTSISFSKVMGGQWLSISLVLFIISLILRQVPLLLVATLFFMTGGVARLWEHYCLNRVEYRRRLSADRAFFGDEILLEVEVANRKPLPLPWIQIEDEVPSDITFLKGKTSPSIESHRLFLGNILSLGWYHKVK